MITRRKLLTRLGLLSGLGATFSEARGWQEGAVASAQAQVTALANRVAGDMPMRIGA